MKTLNNFFLYAGLLVVLVLSASSISNGRNPFHPPEHRPPVPTPGPVSMLLFGTGLAAVGVAVRRRLRGKE